MKKYKEGEIEYENITRIDISGMRSGFLTADRYAYSIADKHGKLRPYFVYKCDCGKEIIRRRDYLKKDRINKSCGCYKKSTGSSINDIYRMYKFKAKERNLNFDLTIDDFKNITSQNCYYCGTPPTFYISKRYNCNNAKPIHKNGIDRFDNNKGYSVNNCVPCCTKCNRSKMDLNYKDWINHIIKIYENFQKTVDI